MKSNIYLYFYSGTELFESGIEILDTNITALLVLLKQNKTEGCVYENSKKKKPRSVCESSF